MRRSADIASAEAALAEITDEARAEVANQGVDPDHTEPRAHLRYDGSHQALEVPFGTPDQMLPDFEAAHKSALWLHLARTRHPVRHAECRGDRRHRPIAPPPICRQAMASPAAQIPMHSDGTWQDVPLYDREALAAGLTLHGPAIITEPTGTNMIEPGWAARLDALGNLILERITAKARDHAAGTKADPVLLEVFNNLFMSVADQMGATLANTSWSVNIKERLDFSCAIFDAHGDLVANAPHVPVHLGSMSDSVKTVMRVNAGEVQPGDAYHAELAL